MKLLAVAVLLLAVSLPFTVQAEGAPFDTWTAVDSNGVTYTYKSDESPDGVIILVIDFPDTVDQDHPIDLVIPAELDGHPVTGLNLNLGSGLSLGVFEAQSVRTLSFAGEVPVIHGNLYTSWEWLTGGTLGIESQSFAGTFSLPDTEKVLAELPGFITDNYNHDSNGDGTDDTYYVGTNLVRVDPAYSGALTVKDGTVSILAGAMEGCASLGAVTLPDSVEFIGVRAFANSGVTSVNIPKGLMTQGADYISYLGFYGCEKLASVTFPEGTDTLANIGYMAFVGCKSLTGFDFTRVETIQSLTFVKAFAPGAEIDLSNTVIGGSAAAFSHSGVEKVIFGGSKNSTIPFEMFRKCTSLTEIVWSIQGQVAQGWSFSDCTGLTADILADSNLTFLDHRSFANTGMTEVTIPASVTLISGGALAGNEQLTTLNWKSNYTNSFPLFALLNDCPKGTYIATPWSEPQAKSNWTEYTCPTTLNLYNSGPQSNSGFFAMQPYLETVNFCFEADAVKNSMFQFCPSLKTVNFNYPEKVKNIGDGAFMGCNVLKNFPFDRLTELTGIDNNAFLLLGNGLVTADVYGTLTDVQKGYGLTEVDLSKCTKLTTMGNAAFFNQYSVTKAHIPASVTSFVNAVFSGTVSMKEVVIDGDVFAHMFATNFITGRSGYNENLETVTLNGQILPSTGRVMFCRMTALKTVNITEETDIPDMAFLGCTALENVYAPKVTSVGNLAFMNTGLKEVVISKDVAYGNYVFMNCTALEKVIVEEGVTELGDFMFEGTTALERVSLPSTLKTVNWGAFKNSKGCTINVPASVETVEDDAFVGNAFELIFRGAPVVELTYPGFDENTVNIAPIDKASTIYYVDNISKTAAEVYVASVDAADAPEIKAVSDLTEGLTISGTPERVVAGEVLDLTGVKVTYNGTELQPAQYALDYDATDETLGVRTVKVTPTDDTLAGGALFSNISAKAFDGENVSGKVGVIKAATEMTTSFEVDVVDHWPHVFTNKVSDQMVSGATCTAQAVYKVQCDFPGCTEVSDELTVASGEFAAHQMTETQAKGNSCTEPGHNAYYTCDICGDVFKDEEGTEKTSVEGETIPEKGHDFDVQPEFMWAEDYSCKAVFNCAHGCETAEEKTCTVISKSTEGADCKTRGTVTYTAVCGAYSDIKTAEGEYGDHRPSEAVRENEVPATCKAAGSYDEVVYCSVCGDVLSRVEKSIDRLTTHTDEDNDGKCDVCDMALNTGSGNEPEEEGSGSGDNESEEESSGSSNESAGGDFSSSASDGGCDDAGGNGGSPETGDGFNTTLWIALMCVSAMIAMLTEKKRRAAK